MTEKTSETFFNLHVVNNQEKNLQFSLNIF